MNMARAMIGIDSALLKEASELTGVSGKTALLRSCIEALIARDSVRVSPNSAEFRACSSGRGLFALGNGWIDAQLLATAMH